MPRPSRSPEEWDAIIDRYLASGLTQRAFCERNGVSFDAFRGRYQKSAKFAGTRRVRKDRAADAATGAFVPVRTPSTRSAPVVAAVTIRLAGGVVIECPLALGPEAIARIAREASR